MHYLIGLIISAILSLSPAGASVKISSSVVVAPVVQVASY